MSTRSLLALMVASLIATTPAAAAVIGFDLTLTATSSNAAIGSGVTAGDGFTGAMFFDEADLTPDGVRGRSVIPGTDTLTIAGVDFSSILNSNFWKFQFTGGAPICFDLGSPCGDGSALGITDLLSPGRIIFFRDDLTGTASVGLTPEGIPLNTFSFIYSFASQQVSEPGTLALVCLGLAGMRCIRRRRAA